MRRVFFQRLDDLERQHSLDAALYRESELRRAARNAVSAKDPQAWRAAEVELRRAGEFERAVYCQSVADDLELRLTKGDA